MAVEKEYELHAILQEIRDNGKNLYNNGESSRPKWTKEDVDRLLEKTDRSKKAEQADEPVKHGTQLKPEAEVPKKPVMQKNSKSVVNEQAQHTSAKKSASYSANAKQDSPIKQNTPQRRVEKTPPRSAAINGVPDSRTVDLSKENRDAVANSNSRVKDIMTETAPKGSGSIFGSAMRTAKLKFSEIVSALKLEDEENEIDNDGFYEIASEVQDDKKKKKVDKSVKNNKVSDVENKNNKKKIQEKKVSQERTLPTNKKSDLHYNKEVRKPITPQGVESNRRYATPKNVPSDIPKDPYDIQLAINDEQKTKAFEGIQKEILGQTKNFENMNAFKDALIDENFFDGNRQKNDEPAYNKELSDIIPEYNEAVSEDNTPEIASEFDIDIDKLNKRINSNKEANSNPEDNRKTQMREEMAEGQIAFDVFKDIGDEPISISESQAERDLLKKRHERLRGFSLLGDDDESDPYGSDEENEKLGELFETSDVPQRLEKDEEYNDLEYKEPKDARRVLKFFNDEKKKTFKRIIILAVLVLVSLITGIAAAVDNAVEGDKMVTIFIDIVLVVISLFVGNHTIVDGISKLKKKKVTVNTFISFAVIAGILQNILMFVLNLTDKNVACVFSGTVLVALLTGEINSYIVSSRTFDTMNFCTGRNRERLFSIESVNDDNDIMEFVKYTKKSGTRIRYSCKTKFPSRVVQMCTDSTSADKLTKMLLPLTLVLGAINFVVAWLVKGEPATGFAAFTLTLTMGVPAYGALLIQLPLRWTNMRLNKIGSMISCQESVEELCRTNTILIDSRDLFDKNACSLAGYKNLGNVSADVSVLYAAAMGVRSGGPLTSIFDQMIGERRDILPKISNFSYEEKLGVSGWINNQKVLLGNRNMMQNHNIAIPSAIDEDRYHLDGYEVLYLTVSNAFAAVIVVNYVADKALLPYLKKLRDSGVNILVRNCDQNVTEKMISEYYNERLSNIKIVSVNSGRLFKKYKAKPKVATRATCIHDGSTLMFLQSLCTAATLRHLFKLSNMLMFVGIFLTFGIVFTLSILNVFSYMPAVFAVLFQLISTGAFVGIIKIISKK